MTTNPLRRHLILRTLGAGLTGAWSFSPSRSTAQAPALPQVAAGRIDRLADLPSRHVAPRHVDVWLPEGYDPSRRHQVLYMHDGQMLFDASTTWNKQAWGVDQTLNRLMKQGRLADTLVVGVWNNGKFRHSEYFPEKHLPFLPEAVRQKLISEGLQGQPRADAYLRFMVKELKPAIDARYATRPEAASTFIMGSSMGGLISVYAMNEYPQVFGGAAGLSTHWIGSGTPNAAIPLAALRYLQQNLADPASHRIYQDHGTTELDALYAPYQPLIDQLMRDKGYAETGPAANFMTRVFAGTGHNERAWADRLDVPVLFLMGRR
ncbi:alpha/beta hydrolase [Ideonella sp.]|uniref:alpha/beta hydrolase n=1 Tax=Ideonella sp. TaxID=1929293 RepID=UPI003BB70550